MKKRQQNKLYKKPVIELARKMEYFLDSKPKWVDGNAIFKTPLLTLCIFRADKDNSFYSQHNGKVVFDFTDLFDKWSRAYFHQSYIDTSIEEVIGEIAHLMKTKDIHFARSLQFEKYENKPEFLSTYYQQRYDEYMSAQKLYEEQRTRKTKEIVRLLTEKSYIEKVDVKRDKYKLSLDITVLPTDDTIFTKIDSVLYEEAKIQDEVTLYVNYDVYELIVK